MNTYLLLIPCAFLLCLLVFIRQLNKYKGSYSSFHNFIDNINIGYFIYRIEDGVILDANKGFLNILDLDLSSKNDIEGRVLEELLADIDIDTGLRDIHTTNRTVKGLEYKIRTLTGKEKHIRHNSFLTFVQKTRGRCMEAFIEDVTVQKISVEMMKESRERYEKLFKGSADMIVIFHLMENMEIEEVNPITEVITGFNQEELNGYPFEKLFHPHSRKKLAEVKDDLIFKERSNMEAIVVSKDGSYRDTMITFSVVDIGQDTIVIALFKDISGLMNEKDEQDRRKKELEDFCKASGAREQRIKDLREELERMNGQLQLLKEKNVNETGKRKKQ